jgi:hypothetical protein
MNDQTTKHHGPHVQLRNALRATGGATLALFLAITPTPAGAQAPTWQQPVPASFAAGCEVTMRFEDGHAFAYCPEDGSTIAYDPDGQLYVNDAGVPLRRPGFWYPVTDHHR